MVNVPLFTRFKHHPRWCRISSINRICMPKLPNVSFNVSVFVFCFLFCWVTIATTTCSSHLFGGERCQAHPEGNPERYSGKCSRGTHFWDVCEHDPTCNWTMPSPVHHWERCSQWQRSVCISESKVAGQSFIWWSWNEALAASRSLISRRCENFASNWANDNHLRDGGAPNAGGLVSWV